MSEGTEEQAQTISDSAVMREPSNLLRRVFARREAGVLFGFVIMNGIIAFTRPDIFFDLDRMPQVWMRLLRTASIYIIIGIGMSYLIIGGEFDLSVGSMFAVGGVLFSLVMEDFRLTSFAALIVVLALAAGVGLTNGLIVTKIGVPSLITTIGMLSVLRGIALYLTPAGARSVPQEDFLINAIGGRTDIAGTPFPHQVLWAFALVLVLGFILQKTSFGYHIYAIGDDQDAAEMTGINTDRVKLINFALIAMLAAFAGIISISFFGSMFATSGRGFELLVIAAVVIGGTNLFGGEGSLTGMVLGALVIAIIPQLLVLNGLEVEIQEFLTGVVIIVAVVVDIMFRRR